MLDKNGQMHKCLTIESNKWKKSKKEEKKMCMNKKDEMCRVSC